MGDAVVIPHPDRQKGGALQLGARRPGETGPFGVWPEDDDQADVQEDEPEGGGHD